MVKARAESPVQMNSVMEGKAPQARHTQNPLKAHRPERAGDQRRVKNFSMI